MNGLAAADRQILEKIWSDDQPKRVYIRGEIGCNAIDYDWVYLVLFFNTPVIPNIHNDIATELTINHPHGEVFIPYCSWYLSYRALDWDTPPMSQRGGCLL